MALQNIFGLTTSYFRRHNRLMARPRKPCPLPPEIHRRPPREDAGTTSRALEFALPGQW